MPLIVEDVACTVCGCVCDDLRLSIEGETIVAATGACPLSEPRLVGMRSRRGLTVIVEGRPAHFPEGVERAATLLRSAKAPLICGLTQSSTEGQRAACRLADWIGGTVDTTASLGHAAGMIALQQVGQSTCSLGEARHRSDLVIYWGANPVISHPRHLQRYTVDAQGQFIGGRENKTLIVVDVQPTETSSRADLFIQVEPDSDFELLWALRCRIAGSPVPETWASPSGLASATIVDLAERMKSCRSGVVFFGSGLTRHSAGHATVAALLRLVRELNAYTRFYARGMGNSSGAENVLCWQTGFPLSVNLARGFPRYSPGEYSAQQLLERGEVDTCVLVGCDGLQHLSPAALQRLRSIPTIVLDPSDTQLDWQPNVIFPTARYGIDRPGTAYRMDEVPIPLRQVLNSDVPSDGEVLSAILQRLKQ